jgi:peptide deformylase
MKGYCYMAIRDLCYFEDKTLRKKSKNVERMDAMVVRLMEDMAETMYASNGIGLAAPQVGVSKRVIVVDAGEGLIKVANPKIVKSEGLVEGTEGCLSLPMMFGEVDRAQKVIVKGLDEKGEPFKVEAEGMLARVFQHEIDHLDGILFIDKARNIREVTPEETSCEEPGAEGEASQEDGGSAKAKTPRPLGQVLTCLEETVG